MAEHRRTFLKTMAATAGVGLLPASIQRALALPANKRTGTIEDVRHIVFLMQENRSFDHYFGTLRGVRGFDDPCPLTLPSGRSVFHQPVGMGLEDAVLPFRLNARSSSAASMKELDHSWKGQHALWKNHDAWIPVKSPLTMGHFTREDIPYYYALADAFTICDAYHCSLFGPTNPNRLFFFSGTSGMTVRKPGLHTVTNADDGNWTADPAKDDKNFAGYSWTTYAERLQQARISWKVYQEHDNYGDNSLAYFKQFRNLDPASEAHARARSWAAGSNAENGKESYGEHLLAAFAKDVREGKLPTVSWIVAPFKACEHPEATPGAGEAFTAGLIDALTADPKVWGSSVLFLNYDENDGFFDHMPPPLPATDPSLGASTVHTVDENFMHVPMGLGPRVPMIAVSPWSKGGWVNSEVFDHTSALRFLEARFGIAEPNISAWRRAVCGDLQSLFDFATPDAAAPKLPATAGNRAADEAAAKLAYPAVPDAQAMPRQEPGSRPARALPYRLQVQAAAADDGALQLEFVNEGTAGACFHVHAGDGRQGPWFYTVEAGKKLPGVWGRPTARIPAEGHNLTVYGPDGFFRHFRGGTGPDLPELEVRYEPAAGRIALVLQNRSKQPCSFRVSVTGDLAAPDRRHSVAPGASVTDSWPIADSAHWYDLSVESEQHPGWLRRVAGHMATGKASRSDPAIGGGRRA